MPAQCPLLGSAGRWRMAAERCRHVYYWRCAAVLYEPLAMRAQRCAGGGVAIGWPSLHTCLDECRPGAPEHSPSCPRGSKCPCSFPAAPW